MYKIVYEKRFKTYLLLVVVLFFVFYGANNVLSSNNDDHKEHITKDEKYVYCGKSVISNADPASVVVMDYIYAKDNNNVYYCDRNYDESMIIEGADPATFDIFVPFYYAKDKNAVYHQGCWNQYCNLVKTKIDPETVVIVDADVGIIKDKNGVFTYSFDEFKDADVDTFSVLSPYFFKDKNNVYSINCGRGGCIPKKIINADPSSFEVFKEVLGFYAMDKNNIFAGGSILSQKNIPIINKELYNKLKGRIIFKSEDKGEAYYVNPFKKEMYFLSNPVVAFFVMRQQGVGITNFNLEKIPVGGSCPSYNQNCDISNRNDYKFSNGQRGRIFLQVEGKGEAWYVNPSDKKRYFLGRPADAFKIMKTLGLGISNKDFEKLTK